MREGVMAAMVLTLASTAIARAEPTITTGGRTARLDVSGACEMPRLARTVDDMLGRVGIDVDAVAFLSVTSERVGRELRASLMLQDEQRVVHPVRTVSGASCAEVQDAIAVVIALTLQQEPAPSSMSATVPEVPPPPPPPTVPVPEVPVERVTVEASAPVGETSARVAVQVGLAGGSGRDAVLSVGVVRGRWGIEARGFAPREESLVIGRLDVLRFELAGSACARRGEASACAVASAGVVRGAGAGEGLMAPDAAVLPVAGAGVRVQWQRAVGSGLAVRVFGELTELVVAARFLVDDEPVWTTPGRTATVGAGMSFQLP